MDKEVDERMHETMQSVVRLADRANCPDMENVRRCTRLGMTMLCHIIELLERILDKRLSRTRIRRGTARLNKGRDTPDGMISLRQLVDTILERQGHMALTFVDLEKAFDSLPRKMAMATLRRMRAQ